MQILVEFAWLISACLGVMFGAILMFFYLSARYKSANQQNLTPLQAEVSALQTQLSEANTRYMSLSNQLAVAGEREKQLTLTQDEIEKLRQQVQALNAENSALKTRLLEQNRHAQEKIQLLQDAETRLSIQFENLANKVLDNKGKQITEQHQTHLNQIVNPLKEQIGEFKKRIESVYENESKDRVSLRQEIIFLKQQTLQITQEANNLAHALKGDKKVQGNWGEMVLEKVLQQSGLRKGIEYETQGGFRDQDNNLFKPDVIIRLPDNKDVVVDSKVSLSAYEQYCSALDDDAKKQFLNQHVNAVRDHIKSLSDKDYSSLKGLRSLDFVLLFMPIEAAFMVAFEHDEKLFNSAFEHKIVVVTPTTLLATLRTIENIWRYERQNENARLIADRAGALYDKIRGFSEDLEKLGSQLNTVAKTYDGVMNKLAYGNGNLIRQADSFVELGIKVKKSLPKSLTEKAGLTNKDKNT